MSAAASAGRVETRMAELALALPEVPAPAGTYVPALIDGTHVWTSGQLPFVDGGLRRHLCTGDDGSANVGQPLRIRGAGRGARGRGGWRHSHRPGARDRGRRQ